MKSLNNVFSGKNTIDYSAARVNYFQIYTAKIYVLPNYIAVIYKDGL